VIDRDGDEDGATLAGVVTIAIVRHRYRGATAMPSRFALWTVLCCASAAIAMGQLGSSAAQTAQPTAADPAQQIAVARSWHGKTSRANADEYEKYLAGRIVNLLKIKGNVGYEFHRLDNPPGGGDVVELEVVSFWASLKAIEAFAGSDITLAHDAPRDPEFLIDKETYVRNYRVVARGIVKPDSAQ